MDGAGQAEDRGRRQRQRMGAGRGEERQGEAGSFQISDGGFVKLNQSSRFCFYVAEFVSSSHFLEKV